MREMGGMYELVLGFDGILDVEGQPLVVGEGASLDVLLVSHGDGVDAARDADSFDVLAVLLGRGEQ